MINIIQIHQEQIFTFLLKQINMFFEILTFLFQFAICFLIMKAGILVREFWSNGNSNYIIISIGVSALTIIIATVLLSYLFPMIAISEKTFLKSLIIITIFFVTGLIFKKYI